MLDVLRTGAQTWVAKLLMLILVASFGVWGISGSLLSNLGGGNAVIKVGDVKVGPNEFRLAYNRDLAMMSQQLGTRLTSEQAKAFGIEGRVYSQLAAGAALDQLADNMDLGVSKDQLAQFIASDQAFHDASGNFDRQTFNAVLQNAGMSEKDYITSRSRAATRSQLIDSIGGGFKPPVTLVEAILEHQNEKRDIAYLLITKDLVDPVKAPSDDALKAYFEKNKAAYAAPEYRKLTYATLTPKDIADPSAVSETEARAYYDSHKNLYGTPEKRTIDQLVFSDKKAADAAAQKLKSGTSFDELVKAQGKAPADARLGTYAKADLPEQNLADAAFAVKEAGGTTGVVDGSFGPVILRVSEIKPASVKPFDEVKGQIREDLALQKAGDRLLDVHDAYEDARAGGATLQEAAKKEGMKSVVIDAVDRNGQTPDGKALKTLPESQELLKAAFEGDQGVEIPSINLGSDGYLWVEVLDTMPAHDRKLEEVHDKVVADWNAAQVSAEIEKKAADIKKAIDGGKSLEQVASELGISVETKSGIKRSDSDPVVGEAAVQTAFSGPKGLVTVAASGSGDDKLVLKVTGVTPTATSGYDALEPRQVEALAGQTTNDIFSQMVAMLQDRYGVSINQNLGDQAIRY